MTVATQVSVPKVVTDNKDVNQLQQNSITAINKLQQQINTITGTVNGIANTPAPVTPTVTYPTSSYYSGYQIGTWNTNGAMGDGTNVGGNTLTQRYASGLTVTAAASNVAGITFTPASATAVYLIKVNTSMAVQGSGGVTWLNLTDGTTVLDSRTAQYGSVGTTWFPTTFTTIYAPASTSAKTVKIQIQNSAGPSSSHSGAANGEEGMEWTIVRLV
jgi:hypothetical protein